MTGRGGAEASSPPAVGDLAAGLVLRDGREAAAWERRLETAVLGLCARAVTSPDALVADRSRLDLVLVEPSQRAGAEAALPGLPLLDADLESIGWSDQRLAAFVLMALLIAFMDARRTGCLHIAPRLGEDRGLIVFRRGRIAWAHRLGSSASLAAALTARLGCDRGALRRATDLSARERVCLAEALSRDGPSAARAFRAALKDYVVVVVGELLALERPAVGFSTQVTPASHNESFDVTEIVLGGLAP